MISKIFKSSGSFKSVLDYVTQKGKYHEVVLSNGVRDYSKESVLQDFLFQARMNPRIRRNVLHMTLSHHPDDTDKIKDCEINILKAYFEQLKQKGIDFYKTQFIVCRHNDQPHPHYHIVANYVSDDFTRFTDSLIGIRSKAVCKAVTRQFGLTTANLQERKAMQEKKENQSKNRQKITLLQLKPMEENSVENQNKNRRFSYGR